MCDASPYLNRLPTGRQHWNLSFHLTPEENTLLTLPVHRDLNWSFGSIVGLHHSMLDSLFVYTLSHLHIDRVIALDIDQRLVITQGTYI